MQQNREPGISFVVRVRNEEAYLQGCLQSLEAVQVPHEIVLILHLCTDGSKRIAEEALGRGQPIRILEYSQPISRAGFENLITPVNHKASIATYYNFCFQAARFRWLFKWDADCTLTDGLAKFLNGELNISEPRNIVYRLNCVLGDKDNCELYLFNCLINYGKQMFWEVPYFAKDASEINRSDLQIKSISPAVIKTYWRAKPWFYQDDSPGARTLRSKYDLMVSLCGEEPPGLARAQSTEFFGPWERVIEQMSKLNEFGIQANS